MLFQAQGLRQVVADFVGGYLSNDSGVLLLRQLDHGSGLTATLAGAYTNRRDPGYCDHRLRELVAQRLYGLALGCEDLNDLDMVLRCDPLLAVAAARARCCLTGAASVQEFKDLAYQTLKTRSRPRRVVAKAEVMAAEDNPRFGVINLPREGFQGKIGNVSAQHGARKKFTVRAGTWRTDSNNKCSTCARIG